MKSKLNNLLVITKKKFILTKLKRQISIQGPKYWCIKCKKPITSFYQKCCNN